MYLFLHAPWYIDRKEVHRQFLGGYTHLYKNPSHNVRVYDLLQNQPYPKSLDSSFWYLYESFISITLYHIKWIIVFVICPYMTNLSLIIKICWKYIHVFWFAPKKDWLIDCFVFYAVLAIFQPWNGGVEKEVCMHLMVSDSKYCNFIRLKAFFSVSLIDWLKCIVLYPNIVILIPLETSHICR